MKKSKFNKYYAISAALYAVFAVLTVLIKNCDVGYYEPIGENVGFSKLNFWFFDKVGANPVMDTASELIKYLCLFIMVVFAAVGAYQWLKRKNILKVDMQILLLGGIYLVMLASYMIFEMLKINYRPEAVDGVLKASYPSSHTIIGIVVLGTFLRMLEFIKIDGDTKKAVSVVSIALAAAMVVSRAMSGMHWLTDVIASVPLGIATVMLYIGLTETLVAERRRHRSHHGEHHHGSGSGEIKNGDGSEHHHHHHHHHHENA